MRARKIGLWMAITVAPFLICCDLSDLFSGDPSDTSISEARIAEGLKEALSVGIDSASGRVSKLNGYLLNEAIKILLPQDAQAVLAYTNQLYSAVGPYITLLNMVGIDPFNVSAIQNAGDSLMVALNRAAEKAAPQSVSIFKDAIFGLTITQALDILHGDSIAATTFLEGKTYSPLTNLYEPFVDSTLELVHANQFWQSIATSYNQVMSFYNAARSQTFIPAGILPVPPYDSLTTDLSNYTTTKALDGLFYVVGQEETRIRVDPVARVTELLKEVFGLLD